MQKKTQKSKAKVKMPKANVVYAFLAVWKDNKAGWMGASHLCGTRNSPDYPADRDDQVNRKELLDGNRLFMCKITIEPLKTKTGKPITRIYKNKK